MELQAAREKLRVCRENMLTVVSEYNSIIEALAPHERALFADRIRVIDKKLAAGLSTLTWTADKAAGEFFYREVRKQCREGQANVTVFKGVCGRMEVIWKKVGELLLLSLERKRVYDQRDFAA